MAITKNLTSILIQDKFKIIPKRRCVILFMSLAETLRERQEWWDNMTPEERREWHIENAQMHLDIGIELMIIGIKGEHNGRRYKKGEAQSLFSTGRTAARNALKKADELGVRLNKDLWKTGL